MAVSQTKMPSAGAAYSLFYGGQFVLLGFQLPFFAGWLALRGFSTPEIGWITGVALIARLTLGPFVAFWADHQADERRALRWSSFFFAAGAASLLLTESKILIAAASALVIWTFGLLIPLTDTAVLRADRNGHLHYGQTRAAGTAFFLMTTVVGGMAITQLGIEAVVWFMAIAAAAAYLMTHALPAGAGGRGGAKPISWREAPRLLREPAFLLVLFSAGLAQGAHAVYYAFSYLRWEELGYSPLVIGLLWSTGVIVEIFVLARARGLARRFGPAVMLMIGGAATFVRWAVIGLEPPLWILFPIQTLHACTFAAAYLGSIEFLDRATPLRLVNTGMTLMSATGVGAITGLATVATGYVWKSMGAGPAYYCMSAMGVGAFVLALLAARTWRGGQLFD